MVDTHHRKCMACRKMSPGDARFCIHCAAAFSVLATERLRAGATARMQYSRTDPLYCSTVMLDLLIAAAEGVMRHWQNIAIIIGVVCLIYAMSKSSRPIAPDPAWQSPVAAPASISNSYNDNSVNVCFYKCR